MQLLACGLGIGDWGLGRRVFEVGRLGPGAWRGVARRGAAWRTPRERRRLPAESPKGESWMRRSTCDPNTRTPPTDGAKALVRTEKE